MSKVSAVDSSQIASIGAGRAVSRAGDQSGGTPQGAPDSASGSVQITGTARNLANLEQTLRDMPVVDEARVAHIRSAIEQGTYSVRPQHIAEQLLSLERSLRSLPDPEADSHSESGHSGESGK